VRRGKAESFDNADANVPAWTASVDAASLFISAITVMELGAGVSQIARREIPAAFPAA
jgi:predicted nucleic acid-binding protein